MDEFNERLSKYDLSETQLSLIRDIRRRGKNKVSCKLKNRLMRISFLILIVFFHYFLTGGCSKLSETKIRSNYELSRRSEADERQKNKITLGTRFLDI